MKFTNLFDDKRAVSPVIGVILMVAITVILAAVIGTFVLGLSDQVQDTSPRAQIGFDYDQTGGTVDIIHESGDELESANIDIKESNTNTSLTKQTGPYTAGDTIASGTYDSGEDFRVVWSSPEGGSSSTLAKSSAP